MARLMCDCCQRPEARCCCAYVRPIHNRIHVVILQHPDEAGHAKNTGEFLHRCLANSELSITETNAWPIDPSDTALLYPAAKSAATATAPPLPSPLKRLLVLDATWRKSRKMLHLNPSLHSLPRVALNEIPASRYRIRSAANTDQLSTFEASCYALQQLEHNSALCQPALAAFDEYINHLVSFDPNRR